MFAQGHAIDLILLVLGIEFIVLVHRQRWSARAATLRLLPGALMVLAVRAAVTGAGWPWIALALTASLPVHLADLRFGAPLRRDI